jgi:hypothetical protein
MKVERETSNKALRPMKGAHLILNETVLEMLLRNLKQIEAVYSDELNDQNANGVLAALEEMGWTKVKDKFGTKVYEYLVYPVNGHEAGELRVGVVLTSRGELMLDIRPWGEY